MFVRSQLLLWPSFKLSSFARASSPLLRGLLFISRTDFGYAHISHRIYPLQTLTQTSDELIKISSTVSGRCEEGDKTPLTSMEEARSSPKAMPHIDSAGLKSVGVETGPYHEYVCWTDLPSFLTTYSPKVSREAET